MAVSSRSTTRGTRPQSFRLLSVHLLSSFIVVTILNEVKGIGPEPRPNLLPETTAPPYSRYYVSQRPGFDPYNPYLASITGPLGEDDVEFSLDYYSEKDLLKEYNFDPTDILKQLMNSAISRNTAPAQFYEDIANLVSLQNRSKTEQGTSKQVTTPNPIESAINPYWRDLHRLEEKYNVTAESNGPHSVTAARLALMFPHYLNIGQKPFMVPSEVSLARSYQSKVPAFFTRPEFGGLIPRSGLVNGTKEIIMGLHLYALYRDESKDTVPFRTKGILLKRRMEKSVLSDARRLRFLQNNDIIDREGQLLRTSLKTVYEDFVPTDFKNKIDWVLLGVRSSGEAVPTTVSPRTTPKSDYYDED